MNKVEYFRNELDYIKNPQIKAFATRAVELIPDYFFVIPASSTGKYHPEYSLGEGGLARHTRSAIRIAIELARLDWWGWKQDELDLCISALLVHDAHKSGVIQEKFTRSDHPNITRSELSNDSELRFMLSAEQFETFLNIIARHMGQWVFDSKTHEKVLDAPVTKLEKFVHLCDYLASRKCLTMEFDVPVIRETK